GPAPRSAGSAGRRRLGSHRRARSRPGVACDLGSSAPVTPSVIDIDHFQAVDMRVGRIVAIEEFPEARVPAWKLTIDFGPGVGVKRASAQITHYPREHLEDTLVVAVVNFPPRQIGPFRSE